MFKDYKQAFTFAILLFLFLSILMPKNGSGDIEFWINWSNCILNNGIGCAYRCPTLNYNPFYIYLLRIYVFMQGNSMDIVANIHVLKIITLAFDFLCAFFLLYFVGNKPDKQVYPYFLILNAAFLYNSIIWGQIDSIFTFFVLAAIIFLIKGNSLIAVVFYVLAINTKTQAIIFMPLIGLVLLFYARNYWNIIISGLVFIVCQIIIFLPFLRSCGIEPVIENFNGAVDFYPVVSMNAYNIWYFFITETDPFSTPDTLKFLGITYKKWGVCIFSFFSFIAMLPLIYCLYLKKFKMKVIKTAVYYKLVLLCGAIISISFFYFNTQMHERYGHPAIVFLAGYFFLSKKFTAYVLFSLAYLLSLDRVMHYMKMNYQTILFDPKVISLIFLLSLLNAFYRLFKEAEAMLTNMDKSN